MPTLDGVDLAGFGELLQRVGARRLQQPVARAGIVRIGDDQRARHELREQVDHREFVDRTRRTRPHAAASSVKPPAKTASRRSTTRSCSASRS